MRRAADKPICHHARTNQPARNRMLPLIASPLHSCFPHHQSSLAATTRQCMGYVKNRPCPHTKKVNTLPKTSRKGNAPLHRLPWPAKAPSPLLPRLAGGGLHGARANPFANGLGDGQTVRQAVRDMPDFSLDCESFVGTELAYPGRKIHSTARLIGRL